MFKQRAYLLLFLLIKIILVPFSPAGADQEQQPTKILVSLTHSGNDPVGFMLYTMVKHQISISEIFKLVSEKEIPIIHLELITFDPDKADTEYKGISCGYASVWTSTEGYHIMAAAGVSGRDRLKPVADEIVAKTRELIPTAKQQNEKSAEAGLRHIVALDLMKENDELRDRVAMFESKVYKLEMELAAEKKKSWWQRLWSKK